jgi:hypothetical protein
MLLAAGRTSDTLNVASGVCVPVTAIVDEISRLSGRAPDRFVVDAGEAQHFDITAVRAVLPSWDPDETWWRSALERHLPAIVALADLSGSPARPRRRE